jgi:hypothetical protein
MIEKKYFDQYSRTKTANECKYNDSYKHSSHKNSNTNSNTTLKFKESKNNFTLDINNLMNSHSKASKQNK